MDSWNGVLVRLWDNDPSWLENGEPIFHYGIEVKNEAGGKIAHVIIELNVKTRDKWNMTSLNDYQYKTSDWVIINSGCTNKDPGEPYEKFRSTSPGCISIGEATPRIIGYTFIDGGKREARVRPANSENPADEIMMRDQDLEEWCNLEISREQAEKELSKPYDAGTFIIRSAFGKNSSEALALTVKCVSEITHYALVRENRKFRLQLENHNEHEFVSIASLVKHYSRFSDRTKQQLTYSFKKKCATDFWSIDFEEVEILMKKRLGSGAFGEVFEGLLDGRSVAVKKPTWNAEKTPDFETQFILEAGRARGFSHPNIARTIGVCTFAPRPFIVVEYLSGGSLEKYLQNADKNLTHVEHLKVATQIASAMAYLEEHKLVHRDLAARNILIGESLDIIKLADFGMARRLYEDTPYRYTKINIPYYARAPEAFDKYDENYEFVALGNYTSKSDVWAFGVLLWDLTSNGATSFYDTEFGLLTRLADGLRLSRPDNCSDAMHKMMRECWEFKPKDRPTFAELCTDLDKIMKDVQKDLQLTQEAA